MLLCWSLNGVNVIQNRNKENYSSSFLDKTILTIFFSPRLKDYLTPVGINEKGFVNSNFGMFLLLDYCITFVSKR